MDRRRALAFILLTALLDSIGFGIILPVMPKLIMDVAGGGLNQAARYGGLLMMVYALMQFFCAPLMGNLSDRYGRRPVLLIALAALCGDYILMSWAPTLLWLFLGRTLAGAAASTFSTCSAFIADVTPPERRAQSFGALGAAFGVGFVVGPVVGGLLGGYGPRVPFMGAAALTAVNFCYGALLVPETLSGDDRRPFQWRRANPIGTLTALRRYPMVMGLVGAHFLFMLGHHVLPSTWSYFTMERFNWSEREVGYSLGFAGLLMVLMQAVVLRFVLARVGERRAAVMGYVSAACAFVGYSFATHSWMLYLFLMVGSLQGFASPSVRAIMSAQIPPNAQGELSGGLASLVSLTSIISPLAMTQLFGFFTAPTAPVYLPGAPYLAATVLTLMAFALFAAAIAKHRAQPTVPGLDG